MQSDQQTIQMTDNGWIPHNDKWQTMVNDRHLGMMDYVEWQIIDDGRQWRLAMRNDRQWWMTYNDE